jgi:hypothetical protein
MKKLTAVMVLLGLSLNGMALNNGRLPSTKNHLSQMKSAVDGGSGPKIYNLMDI